MTICDTQVSLYRLLKEGEQRLEEKGIPDAKTDAWYLLSYAADITREQYFLHMKDAAEQETVNRYRDLLKKREQRVPLQYLTGVQEFMGLKFMVNEHVLIPRQDTETLVEEAAAFLHPGDRVLDLCTGSGCILLSLCSMCSIEGVGADISEAALRTAEENARKLGLSASWIQSDLFDHIEETYDMIVSNPPYIPTSVLSELMPEVRLFEPRKALDGSEDGLFFYRRISEKAGMYLRPGGRLLFEIGYDQAAEVSDILGNAGFSDINIKKDLCGNDRVVSACMKK